MSRLEELCRPFLALVCARGNFARTGVPVDPDALKAEALSTLAAMRAKCENDPVLFREFERVEKPLAFFADYCIRESGTDLSTGWRDLGREYNELSGDEKFYDLLTSTLEDPEASDRLRLFYLMLGLGFEGVHLGDAEFVQRRMRLCATRFSPAPSPSARLRPDVETPYPAVLRRSHTLAACFVTALVLFVGALAYNYYRFCGETNDYHAALMSANAQAEAPALSVAPAVKEVRP